MHYYIINNKITVLQAALDPAFYVYEEFTPEQIMFYEEHNGNITIEELRTLIKTPVYEPTLEQAKIHKIEAFSRESFEYRERVLPEYKLVNAGLGIYSESETNAIKATVEAYRNEFYRLKGLCEAATTKAELSAIVANYPIG